MEQRIRYLFEGYQQGRLTLEERVELGLLFDDPAAEPWLVSVIDQELYQAGQILAALKRGEPGVLTLVEREQLLNRIRAAMQEGAGNEAAMPAQAPVRPMRKWWLVAAAAVIVIAAGVGLYWQLLPAENPRIDPPVTVTPSEIAPGTNGAVLTLADGRQVVLDSLGNGIVAQQQGAKALLQDGRLVYDADKSAAGAVVYNTMSTPKGRQFQMTLPDGTKVWLNAASSIRYPTTFTGADRTVEVTGEVYFEVAADQQRPFFARIDDATRVAVLGTSFNINAYANENSINTTLLDGKVNVLSLVGTVPLRPGQQAQVQGGNTKVVKANVEQVMAWKNGLFDFRNASLPVIMRQLERWYDIEVKYENKVPEVNLTGKISRDVTLQGLLINLERMGVRTELVGRQLIVKNADK